MHSCREPLLLGLLWNHRQQIPPKGACISQNERHQRTCQLRTRCTLTNPSMKRTCPVNSQYRRPILSWWRNDPLRMRFGSGIRPGKNDQDHICAPGCSISTSLAGPANKMIGPNALAQNPPDTRGTFSSPQKIQAALKISRSRSPRTKRPKRHLSSRTHVSLPNSLCTHSTFGRPQRRSISL